MELPPGTIIAVGPVIVENGKVLLNREIKSDGIESPYFMLPGGTMEDVNTTFEDVCIREAKEELGIDIEIIKPLRPMWVQRPGKNTYAVLIHFLAKRLTEIVPGAETVEWGWYDIDNLPENCTLNVFEIIKDYTNML